MPYTVIRLLFALLLLWLLPWQSGWSQERGDDAEGAALFARYCAACHGSDGGGGVGVPLSLPSFINSVDDHYLRQTIRQGRPGRVMPAFRLLADHQVEALIAHMRRWTGKQPRPYPKVRVQGDGIRGGSLYAKFCADCHGAQGEGGHGTGVTFSRPRELPVLAPALNNPGFLAATTDAMIKTALLRGREGTPMGSFLKQDLQEQDIDDIVVFVRSFERQAPPATKDILKSESPIIVRESPYDHDQTVENVKRAVIGANMRLIRVQYLEQGLVKEGDEDRKQVIVYMCNFTDLYDALAVDPRVGLFLPCRVTIVEQDGKVLIMSINPKFLSAVFNNSELNSVCRKLYDTYINIIEEAIL